MIIRLCTAAAIALTVVAVVPHAHADAAPAKRYANCTALNKDYRHGVARPGGRDLVKGKSKPARGYVVNKVAYSKNTHLDRDKDGVACEKK
ncbi:excalibur calcium-binding domain-containing protein [Gordonia sp. MP11Mi]|uniref:Excalibur calcium-binding domain-containing protein n=1 Tax=Gordonia sp. MP11Mi TaxID=3022769 RepID=A0AA97CVS9_9ACTN